MPLLNNGQYLVQVLQRYLGVWLTSQVRVRILLESREGGLASLYMTSYVRVSRAYLRLDVLCSLTASTA